MIHALLLAACAEPADSSPSASPTFPAGFLWGTATAGFQVDPGCPTVPAEQCEDRASDWYQWVTDPELVADPTTHLSGEPLSDGPGHHELYPQDLELAKALGTDAIRVSIEWSRLFPDGAAEAATTVQELDAFVNADAAAWYADYFDTIRATGLTPLVTLDHYTLPLWVHDGKACHADLDTCPARGWVDSERIVRLIGLYAGWCAREYGDRVDLWGTLNEPLAIVLAGYLLPTADRTNPPGISDASVGIPVVFALVEGHAAMYDAVHAADAVDADGDGETARVGLVPNLAAVAAYDPDSEASRTAAAHGDYVYNRVMLNAAVDGEFDRDLDGVAEEHRNDVAGKMDFLGVNYYTRITFAPAAYPLFGDYAWTDFLPVVLWEEYPEGIHEVVDLATSYGVPVLITENGTTPTETSGDTFLRPHLQALLDAVEEGDDVRGYFYWSLMDNYEWNHGMSLAFGLYAVDVETKARTLRPIGEAYRDVIAAGRP